MEIEYVVERREVRYPRGGGESDSRALPDQEIAAGTHSKRSHKTVQLSLWKQRWFRHVLLSVVFSWNAIGCILNSHIRRCFDFMMT